MNEQRYTRLLDNRFFRTAYCLALYGMLHMTVAMPLQSVAAIIYDQPYHSDLAYNSSFWLSPEVSGSLFPEIVSERPETKASSPEEPSVFIPANISAVNKNDEISSSVYQADIKEGVIGISEQFPLDNAIDNLFKVQVTALPQESDKVYLTYDLYGVQDDNAVSRSINDRPAIGGYIISQSEVWSHQKEEIDREWLVRGENKIMFTLPKGAKCSYKIRNLKIEIEKSSKQNIDQQLVIQPQRVQYVKDGRMYLKGFVRNHAGDLIVEADGNNMMVNDGEFEGFIPVADVKNKKMLVIRAADQKGLIGQTVMPVTQIIEADFAFSPEKMLDFVSDYVKAGSLPSQLSANGALLSLPVGSVSDDVRVSVSRLRTIDIAPLTSGMINVTKGGSAYRFTPDGLKFNTPVKLSIEYDTALIPAGYEIGDIRTFFFNTDSKQWEPVETDTVITSERRVISSTTHFTDYINGIIQVPESPQTNAYTPTTMNDIKAADPSSGITMISPPEASQKGDANVSYPIRLPAGRKGMQPQLAVQYNSEGGDSWLGLGWNLSIPGISIDTRWGVPTFGDLNGDGDYTDQNENIETEIYTLGGEQLMYPPMIINEDTIDWMPNRHYEPSEGVYSTIARSRIDANDAFFTFRKQGSFAKIQRLGNSPSTYYWKVIGTDGTISWYGGKTSQDVSDNKAVIKSPDGNIVYWALFMTEDVYGNNVMYYYGNQLFSSSAPEYANLVGGRMFYPQYITYTGFNGSDGRYKVEFIKSTDVKPDVIISARNGFKQTDPYLLNAINVKYNNNMVRSFDFLYKTGRFGKSLLDTIVEKDKDGDIFYSHAFDYYDDVADAGGYYTTSVTERFCDDSCYLTTFSLPMIDTTVYEYFVNDGSYYPYSSCISSSAIKIEYFSVNSQYYYPDQDILYLTHCQNHIYTDLCPAYPITNIELDPVTENIDFEEDLRSFIYTKWNNYNPLYVDVVNNSGVFYSVSGNCVMNANEFLLQFYSLTNISEVYYHYHRVNGLSSGTDYLVKNSSYYSIDLPVEISVSASSGTFDFGPYYLSDPYYLAIFQQQFQQQFSCTPPPTITYENGQVSVYIPRTNLKFNSITVTAGGVSNTYDFTSCNNNEKKLTEGGDDWRNATASKEDIELAVDKSVAKGDELNRPIPEEPLNIAFEVTPERLESIGIMQLKTPNDTLDWGAVYDFNINGTYLLKITRNAEEWFDNNNNRITDQKSINTLNTLYSGDRKKDYEQYQKQHKDLVKKQRLANQVKAKENIQKRYQADWEKFRSKDTTLEKLMNRSAGNNKNTYVSGYDNYLNSRYRIGYRITGTNSRSEDSTECSPFINTSFTSQIITPSYNSAASMLGCTQATSHNAGGYLGAGIGLNPKSKKSTFGLQYTHSWNRSESFVSFTDIDGDGLDDIVLKTGDDLYYRKHVVTRSFDEDNKPVVSHSYGSPLPIEGINEFFYQSGSSNSGNFQATFGIGPVGGFAGIDEAFSKSGTNIYFTDANGDGLIDIAKNGTVFFNHIENGIPVFEADSKKTENMVIVAEPKDVDIPEEYFNDEISLPGYDVVKVWEAPADGAIQIENDIELTETDKEVIVTIEKPLVLSNDTSIVHDTIIIQPGISGKDAYIDDLVYLDSCGGYQTQFTALKWTVHSRWTPARSLIDFDLSSIPDGATINSAILSLYGINSNPGNGYSQYITPGAPDNISQFYRIISPWQENTITWNNQPSISTATVVEVPSIQTILPNLVDINANITSLVQQYIDNRSGSYGFLYKLKYESIDAYRRVVFASSNYADNTKHPKLVVSYSLNDKKSNKSGIEPEDLCMLFGATLNQSQPNISNIITTNSYVCDANQGELTVKKGDRIYFRVHHNETGNPPVNWDPKIEYTDVAKVAITDQNGLTPYSSYYSDGFILSANQEESFSGDGTATITWDPVVVSELSDSVTFEIIRRVSNLYDDTQYTDYVIYSLTVPSGTSETVTSSGLSPITITGTSANPPTSTSFLFRIKANSNVDWKQINWQPKLVCVTSGDLIGTNGTPEATVTLEDTRYPVADLSIYKSYIGSPEYNTWHIDELLNGTRSLMPVLNGLYTSGQNGTLSFVLKSNGQLFGTRIITVTDGIVTFNDNTAIALPNTSGDIEIGFYSDDSQLPSGESSLLDILSTTSISFLNYQVNANPGWISNNYANLFQKVNPSFGPMYRQWGQFMYNPGAVSNATTLGSLPGFLIEESALEFNEDQAQLIGQAIDDLESLDLDETDLSNETSMQNFQNSLNSFKETNNDLLNYPLIVAHPSREYVNNDFEEKWIGLHQQCYSASVSAAAASYSEKIEGFYDPENEIQQEVLATGAYSIDKLTKNKGTNLSAGVNVSAVVASVGITGSKSINGESKSLTDYVDLNGDRYPDIVTTDQVQATNRTGGLYPVTTRNESYSGNLMFSNSHSWGAGATGSFAGGGKSNAGTSVSGKFSLSKPMMSKPQSEIPSGNSSIGISSNYSGSSDEATTLWTDINGDGLYDQVVKNNSDVTIKLNYGNNAYNSSHLADWGSFSLSESASDNHGGGFGISLYSGSIEGGIAKSTNTASQQYTLQDMNGDGLLDIVITDDDKLNVGYNYGTYFAPDTTINDSYSLNENSTSTSESQNFGLSWSWITYFFGVPIKFPCINGNYQHQVSTNRVEKSVTDFDGDGFPDLLEEVGNNTVKVYYSTIRRTNKLKTVHNPLGGSFTVDYQPVVKDYNNPNAKWVMSSVIVDDGYDLVNDGSDTIRKYFEYENGKYDRREREFYGFETVKTIDYVINPDGTKGDVYRTSVQKYYNQSYFLNGLLKEQYVYQGDNENNLFSQTENVYVLKTMQSLNTRINLGSDPLLTFDVGGTEGRRTAIALLSETYNRVYELGASPIVSHLSFEYDNQGRVVNYINDPNVNLANDDYTTAITYYSNQTLTDKNITNIPSHITVTANSVVKRERETGDIDNNTGAIGTILAYIDATTTAETSLDYDTYGNLSYIEFPPNSDNQQMSYTYTYDVDNAKYIESITDAAGYTSSSVYDPKFDALLQTTDITGNKIYYAYDDFGRLTKITGPNEYGIGSDPFTLKFEYYLTLDEAKASYDKCLGGATVFMPLAITRHYDPQHVGNSIDTYTFIDGLGRPVQIKKDIELVDENGYQPSRFEAMSVSGKASYDCFGRVVEQFHPTWEAKDCSLNLVVNETAVQYSSQTEYDELDRPVQTTDPDGNIATTGYSVSGNYAKTRTVVDQNGSQSVITETYKDAQGNVAQTVNVGPSGNVVTAFSYDAIGQLLSYTDADNLTSSYTYDRLGRKLSFSHPDNGLTSYVYDLAGNLSQMQTANLAVTSDYINYTYDYNRLTEVEYPEVGGNPNIANTTFEYGGPAAGNNAGRLVYQSDASGEQSFEYGNMGEVVSTSRTVVAPSPSLPTRTFKLQFAYDSWNRIQSMSYPDYEEVAFAYDLGGNLIKVTGKVQDNPYDYLQDVYYDYYEQRTYVKYGNNTITRYTYSPSMRRLQTLNVKASNAENLIYDTYQYDKVGNITSLVNTAVYNTVNGMGGRFTYDYAYDVLNRLSTSSGSFTGDYTTQQPLGNDYSSSFSLSMVYGNTGTISTKTQSHTKNGVSVPANTYTNTYQYSTGKHRLSRITDQNNNIERFDYDLNGNLTSRVKNLSSTTLYWDEANRLRVYAKPDNTMQHYIYDASGERILKASSTATQVYVNGTLQNNNITMNNYTSYPSGFLVVDPNGYYTKHYYMGAQRFACRLGEDNASIFEGKSADMSKLKELQQKDLLWYANRAGHKTVDYAPYKVQTIDDLTDDKDGEDPGTGGGAEVPPAIYYYHPDHLGTNTFITELNGYAYQVFLNLPFGETMAEQITSSGYYQNHYKFNGKELDNETGMYYYGARYYEPRLSVWMSVDPLMDKYAGISPYAYCVNNPIILVDPKGRDWFETTNDDGSKSVKWNKSTGATFKDKSGTWKNIGNSYNQKLDDGSYINHYQNYISSVGDFEKEEDMIKSHFSFLISNKAEIPIEDKKTIFNSRVASRGVEQPDMIALTFGGNYYVGGGIGYDINLGYIKGEGFFSNLSLKPGPGADVSWGVGLTVGDYRGDGSPNAKSLNGFGTHLSGSLFGLEVSQGMDINYQAGKIGGVWRTTTTGGSFGSSSLMGGSGGVSYTIPLFSKIKLK